MAATESESIIGKTSGGARCMPPEELAMQSLTKQLFKSRLFRGYYIERCYVELIGSYRDIIVLQRSERELEKLLLSSANKLQLFYQRFVPNMWVGITKGNVGNYIHTANQAQLDTCIWTELHDLAFGEYWFSIKTLRFRDQEVQLKLKMIRAVEPETLSTRRSLPLNVSSISNALTAADTSSASVETTANTQRQNLSTVSENQPEIGLADFLDVVQQWGSSIKLTIYDFMVNDVNRHNIAGTLRFLALLIFSLLSGVVVALRFLGIFVLRFLFELSRFTHTATPIFFRLIEFLNRIVGGFFILLTMIWKDLVINRAGPAAVAPKQPLEAGPRLNRLTYERTTSHRHGSRYASTNFL